MKKFQFLIILMTGLVTFSSHAAVKIEHWQTTSGSRVYFVENHDLPILDMSVGFLLAVHVILARLPAWLE